MGAKTLQCEPREPELPAEDRGCRAGGQTHRCDLGPTDATWDPQMLSRMIHTELRMQLC